MALVSVQIACADRIRLTKLLLADKYRWRPRAGAWFLLPSLMHAAIRVTSREKHQPLRRLHPTATSSRCWTRTTAFPLALSPDRMRR